MHSLLVGAVPVDATQQQPQHLSLTVAVVHAATTLCGLHFLACAASIWVVQALGLADRAPLPRAGEPLSFHTVLLYGGLQTASSALLCIAVRMLSSGSLTMPFALHCSNVLKALLE